MDGQQLPQRPMGRGERLRAGLARTLQAQGAEEVQSVRPPSLGRGRAASLLRPLATSTEPPRTPGGVTSEAPVQKLGRAERLLARGNPSLARLPGSLPTNPSSSSSRSPSPPPIKEMEELSIKQYRGNEGKEANFDVNYLRISTEKNKGVFEYHVSYNPIMDSKNLRCRLLKHPDVAKVTGPVTIFDGAKLYLPIKLQEAITTRSVTHPVDGSPVVISIKFIRKSSPTDCIHLYNVLFRRILYVLKMTQIGRHYYDPSGGIEVPQHRLQIWPGMVTAIQEYEGGVMLNCDCSFKVLRNVTALDLIMEDFHTQPRDRYREVAKCHLVGSIVLTRYNNKTYRIDDISWDHSPMNTFPCRGETLTYKDYYKKSYNEDIQDVEQPLLIHKPKPHPDQKEEPRLICLVPELCVMTGLTDSLRQDFKVMRDIAVHTRVTPSQRIYALKKFINNVQGNEAASKILSDWGLKIDPNPISLDGRILPVEKINLKNQSFLAPPDADWSRRVGQEHLVKPVDLHNWMVVFERRNSNAVQDFVQMLTRIAPGMGIDVSSPKQICLNDSRTDTYVTALNMNIRPNLQMVVVVFPTLRDDRYNAVKRICCVEKPVPSQVINWRTISVYAKLRSVTQKIALQMNCKLGGELWTLDIPLRHVMVIGMDSYHDAGRNARSSVLGFVASLNNSLTRWFSQTHFQDPKEEEGKTLRVFFLNALRKFFQVNNTLPQKIFMFRDGVGDGKFSYVEQYEIPQMLAAFKDFGDNYQPHFSFILVQKKINTRIFLRVNGGDKYDNPPPGSVVDHSVTRKSCYDFFLVSQHVRQGTLTPTHYVVLYDSANFKPGHMQRLSYKLTHLYYNWPGTIRVPAPCQYAHKIAYLVGQNIRSQPSVSLADKLFYL